MPNQKKIFSDACTNGKLIESKYIVMQVHCDKKVITRGQCLSGLRLVWIQNFLSLDWLPDQG